MVIDSERVDTPARIPEVWTWYVVYCLAMAAMYLFCVLLGVVLLVVDPSDLEMDSIEAKVQGAVFLLIGMALAVPYALAPFLPKRPWTWVLGIVLIGIGLTSCCCLPASLPLLLAWLKPELKQAFGRV